MKKIFQKKNFKNLFGKRYFCNKTIDEQNKKLVELKVDRSLLKGDDGPFQRGKSKEDDLINHISTIISVLTTICLLFSFHLFLSIKKR